MNDKHKSLAIAAAVTVALGLVGAGIYSLLQGKSSAPRKPPKISLIPTTPPPPPPPPKEDKRPEPPKEQKEVKVDQQPTPPKEAPPAPPSQDLKMDGPAGDGPSAFSSGKITSDDLSHLGKGGGSSEPQGMFSPFNNYATQLKGELQRYLSRHKDLRQRAYKVEVRVWVGADGALSRYEVVGSSGDTELDELIGRALSGLGAFSSAPPDRMPQPIRLRVVTGGR